MKKAIYPVCSSFQELLSSLRDFEDEEEKNKRRTPFSEGKRSSVFAVNLLKFLLVLRNLRGY